MISIQNTIRNLFLLLFLIFEGSIASEDSDLFVWNIDVDSLLSQSQKHILTETDLKFINHASPLSAYAYLGLMYELGEIPNKPEPNLSKALDIYTYSLKSSPDDPNINLLKIAAARVYTKLNRYDEAINILTCEDTSILNMPSSYIILGDIYYKKGDIQLAIDCWRKSWKLNPFTGEINERINLCRQLGIVFSKQNEYDIPLLSDSYNRWLFLKNEAYAHMLYRRIEYTEDKHWIMYELLTDAYHGVPNAMLLLADFYKEGTPHFKANSSLAAKWLDKHGSITDNKMQLSWSSIKEELFYNVDISLHSPDEIRRMISWPYRPMQERGYFFPLGNSTDSYWEYKKLFLLKTAEDEYYSPEEDIKFQLKLLSSDKEEAEQIMANINLEKCSMQTLYIMFDQFNDLKAAKIMLRRSCNVVAIVQMEIFTKSPESLIFSCLQGKPNEPIPSETEKVLKEINVGHPFHLLPDKVKSYWKKFETNQYLIIEC